MHLRIVSVMMIIEELHLLATITQAVLQAEPVSLKTDIPQFKGLLMAGFLMLQARFKKYQTAMLHFT